MGSASEYPAKTTFPKRVWEWIKKNRELIFSSIGILLIAIWLASNITSPLVWLLFIGVACICITIPGRIISAGIILLSITACGLWEFTELVSKAKPLDNPCAAVLVAAVIGWCGLVAGTLYILSRRDDM